ncbi:hypothetical protein CG719_04490 [Streptomyces sp. CB01373]|nr:hypothetical protein CG719_04490 [Streptomyces sp. CB01373]
MARSLQPVIDYYRNKSANVLAANYAETANIGRTISQQMIEAAGIGATIRERLEPMLGLKEYWRNAFGKIGALRAPNTMRWCYQQATHWVRSSERKRRKRLCGPVTVAM